MTHEIEQTTVSLEDLGSSIGTIRQLVHEWEQGEEDPPAVATALLIMLRQAQDFFTDLDLAIREKIGQLEITVPDHQGFSWFSRKDERLPRILDIHLSPKDPAKAGPTTTTNDSDKIAQYKTAIRHLLGSLEPEARSNVLAELVAQQ